MSPLRHLSPLICSSISIFMSKTIIFSQEPNKLIVIKLFWRHSALHSFFYFKIDFLQLTYLTTDLAQNGSLHKQIYTMSSDNLKSKFENMFTTQETFRRNRYYYDALKITEVEQLNQRRRRKPKLASTQHSQKISSSFQSAKKERENKVVEDISKFKFRMSFYGTEEPNPQLNSSNAPEPKSPRNIKGVPLEKVLSRESISKLKDKPCLDQRQFNNFYITTNDLSKTPQIEKYSPRNMNIALGHINDLYYNSQKKYEEVYFDNRTNSCLFNIKKQNDLKGRYFFIPPRPENLPGTEMKPQQVAKSLSVASPFKTNKILQFYKINGRELPCQFDQRHYSPNKNFYQDKDGRLIRQQMSFTSRRYKDELIARDMQELRQAKDPYFCRDEVCDQIYFKQYQRKH